MHHTGKSFSAVLFDLDGTLIDSEPLKAEALGYAIEQSGGTWRPGWYAELLGQPWRTIEERLMVRAGIPICQHLFAELFYDCYQTLLQSRLEMIDGAYTFVHHLHEQGYPLGLVTSESRINAEVILNRFRLRTCFQVLVCGDDFLYPKPAADCYRIACRRMRQLASCCLVFEDTDAGFTAATRAGITQIVGIGHEWNLHQKFRHAFPAVNSFLDLQMK